MFIEKLNTCYISIYTLNVSVEPSSYVYIGTTFSCTIVYVSCQGQGRMIPTLDTTPNTPFNRKTKINPQAMLLILLYLCGCSVSVFRFVSVRHNSRDPFHFRIPATARRTCAP